MNHGSLGYLNENGELSLSQGILAALCLGNMSKLYGLYYKCPPASIDPLYGMATLKDDFMLTPIPFRFWPVTAQLYIHLKHPQGNLNTICEYFKRKGISVIHSEGTRSAFRYGTWNLHIAFENLLKRNLTYNKTIHCYYETELALKELIHDLTTDPDLMASLFTPDSFPAVEGTVNSPLAYFYNYSVNKEETTWLEEKSLSDHFELTLHNISRQPTLLGDSQFEFVIKYLKKTQPEIFPATIFSELHTRALNIRTVLIPSKDSKRFMYVAVEYERIGPNDSCVGIIHSITSRLENYNIWQYYNYTMHSSVSHDKGRLVFLLENTLSTAKKTEDRRSINDYRCEAEEDLQAIISQPGFNHIRFDDLIVLPLFAPTQLEANYQKKMPGEYAYDVFISYSHKDEKYVKEKLKPILEKHHLKVHDYQLEIQFGDIIETKLQANILKSREMCVVVSAYSNSSSWVIAEGGAAWALQKTLVPIILNKENMPDRLKSINWVDGACDEQIEEYARQLVNRKLANAAERFRDYFRM